MICHRLLLAWLTALLVLTACETDSYDKGTGTYSAMTADFADLWVDGRKYGVQFTTDDGRSYVLTRAITASWMKTADSTYRTSVYYNIVDGNNVSVVSIGQVPTMFPVAPDKVSSLPQDPVGLESCWLSQNGKYLNLTLLLKNGRDANGREASHTLAIALDETHTNDDGTLTAYYRLKHDQGQAPEYYTNRRFFSVLLPATGRPDSVRLTVNTYDGVVVKTFKL